MTGRRRGPAAAVALAALALLAAAACSGDNPPSASTTPGHRGSPSAAPSLAVAAAQGPTSTGTFDSTHAAQVLAPAVALVIATDIGSRGTSAEGSGFVFASRNGTSWVLTNNHVVAGARRVQVVMPDGRHAVATVTGADEVEDVAVLSVPLTLPVAQFADSTKLEVGQPVVAIGSPQGSQGIGTVTVGVISALHRTLANVGSSSPDQSPESLADVLQTDAPINPGNSGGPLADGNGRVVGMNTAGTTGASGIGYAIPSAVLVRVAPALMQGKAPGHPYLGICYQTVEDALASNPSIQGFGVVVQQALAGGPAQKAGLQPGDVIEKVDGTSLNDGETLGGVLQPHNPGDTVTMTALRGAGSMTFTVTLGDRPADGGPACPS